MNVNTKNIDSEVQNLDRYISAYKKNSAEIFNEISKISSYWKDNNQVVFENKIIRQKDNNYQLVSGLEKMSSFYKAVSEKYNEKVK